MIMRSRKLVISLGFLCGVAATVPAISARAQPASSSPTPPFPAACTSVSSTASDQAHLLYQAGKQTYDDANYDAAIVQFREAYKKDCSKHELLIIISRAYELNGNRAAAIAALETYLERAPSSPDAGALRNRVENLKKQLAAQPAPAASASTPAPPPQEIREHTVPPWIVVGVGGAAVVTGLILLVAAPKIPPNCDESSGKCTKEGNETPEQLQSERDQAGKGAGFRTAGLACIIGGVGIAVGGVLWHFLEPTGPAPTAGSLKKPKVTPDVSPSYAGVSLGGRF